MLQSRGRSHSLPYKGCFVPSPSLVPYQAQCPSLRPSLTSQAEKGSPLLTHRQALGHTCALPSPLEALKYQNPKQNKNISKAGGTNPMFKAVVLEQIGRVWSRQSGPVTLPPFASDIFPGLCPTQMLILFPRACAVESLSFPATVHTHT